MSRVPVPLVPRWLRWTGVLLVTSVIVYFSILTTAPAPPEPGPIWDKKLHFAAYAGFAYTLAYATVERRHRPKRRIAGVLGAAILFGLAIELVQGTLAMRYYSNLDLLANVIGASLALPWFFAESQVRYFSPRRMSME